MGDWLWVWLVSQREIRNRLAGSPWERFLTHQVALYSPLSKVCSRPLMFFFIALSIFRPCVRARAKKRAADERAASAIWVERSSSTKSFLSSPGGGAPPHAHDRRGPQAARAARRRPKAARRRPPRRRGGARLPHSTAPPHRGHRPQRRVRVGRVRGRARAASRRGLLRTLLSLRGANALPPSASAWPTRPSRSRGRTPAEPSPHAAVRGLDAREHTACGPPSAARPPPPGREGLGRGSPPGQARHGRARHGPARTRVRVRPSWV